MKTDLQTIEADINRLERRIRRNEELTSAERIEALNRLTDVQAVLVRRKHRLEVYTSTTYFDDELEVYTSTIYFFDDEEE